MVSPGGARLSRRTRALEEPVSHLVTGGASQGPRWEPRREPGNTVLRDPARDKESARGAAGSPPGCAQRESPQGESGVWGLCPQRWTDVDA